MKPSWKGRAGKQIHSLFRESDLVRGSNGRKTVPSGNIGIIDSIRASPNMHLSELSSLNKFWEMRLPIRLDGTMAFAEMVEVLIFEE